jgi:hypothetical protein
MGLDQYAYYCDPAFIGPNEVDFEEGPIEDRNNFCYWRKHPGLQGWMEELYRKKGGKEESFNCVPLRLMPEDLDALYDAVDSGNLPHTSGFFFGSMKDDDEVREKDIDFIRQARKLIREGRAVYYSSWW